MSSKSHGNIFSFLKNKMVDGYDGRYFEVALSLVLKHHPQVLGCIFNKAPKES